MREPPERLLVLRDWVLNAEHDLAMAAAGMKIPGDPPTESVCFHAQQAAEKYLKALLICHGLDFPKTHDLGKVAQLLPEGMAVPLSAEEQRRLTQYATVARYPGDYEEISLAEAKKAIALARKARRWARSLLPRAALLSKPRT
jgi:HEPN domain-containing protein